MAKFLVMLEDSQESLVAIRFAAMRAAHSGASVVVLAVIRAEDIQHGFGVADVMRAEARERIEVHYEVFAKWMRERPKVEPTLIIREGDPGNELVSLLAEDPEIGIVVLGASSEAGPLGKRLMRDISALPCVVAFVPATLTPDRLEAIS